MVKDIHSFLLSLPLEKIVGKKVNKEYSLPKNRAVTVIYNFKARYQIRYVRVIRSKILEN